MKKLVSILMAVLMMAVLLPHAVAEEEAPLNVNGLWADPEFDRTAITILNDDEGWASDLLGGKADGGYIIEMYWSNSADSYDSYRMVAHREGNSLVYDNGLYVRVTSEDSEENAGSEELISDAGKGSFTLTEDGTLKWEDSVVEAAAEMKLAREPMDTPTAQELADEYFKVIAAVETGSAGTSLKQAEAVLGVYQFCFNHALWLADPDTLGANMLAAREMLTEEEAAAFDENEPAITAEAIRLLVEDEAVTEAYEEAGLLEHIESLRNDATVRSGVSYFLACVATLENIGEP